MTLDFFPFYYDRWMKSDMRGILPLAARSIYMDLFLRCCSEGSIPTEPAMLAGLAKCSPAELKKYWPLMAHKFKSVDGRYQNEIANQVRRNVIGKRGAGKAGAATRWHQPEESTNRSTIRIESASNPHMPNRCESDANGMASESRKQKAEKRESVKASGVMPPLSLVADPDAEFLRVAKLLCETLPAGGDVHRVVTAMRAEFARSASYEGAPLRFAKSIEAAAIAWRAAYDDNRELRGKPAQYWLADGTYAQKPPQPRQRVDPGPVYLREGEPLGD